MAFSDYAVCERLLLCRGHLRTLRAPSIDVTVRVAKLAALLLESRRSLAVNYEVFARQLLHIDCLFALAPAQESGTCRLVAAANPVDLR